MECKASRQRKLESLLSFAAVCGKDDVTKKEISEENYLGTHKCHIQRPLWQPRTEVCMFKPSMKRMLRNGVEIFYP